MGKAGLKNLFAKYGEVTEIFLSEWKERILAHYFPDATSASGVALPQREFTLRNFSVRSIRFIRDTGTLTMSLKIRLVGLLNN